MKAQNDCATPNLCYTSEVKAIWRAAIEMGFIVFLFYSNLLMGEFSRSGKGPEKGLTWALADILTPANFAIAVIAAMVGYVVFEFLRSKF